MIRRAPIATISTRIVRIASAIVDMTAFGAISAARTVVWAFVALPATALIVACAMYQLPWHPVAAATPLPVVLFGNGAAMLRACFFLNLCAIFLTRAVFAIVRETSLPSEES